MIDNKHQSKHYFWVLSYCYLGLTTFQVLLFCWQLDNNQCINIGVSFYYYPWHMPCGIKVEGAHGIDFLQVVNTTFYATSMDFSKNSSLKNHNPHTYTCFVFCFFLQYYLFLTANLRKIPNMTFTRFAPTILFILSIMGLLPSNHVTKKCPNAKSKV